MRLYIAGPMTGLPDFNYPAFHDAQERLEATGYQVLNPASTGVREGWGWSDYMRAGLTQLLQCDGVALLPGWSDSRGANLEAQVAEQLDMPARPLRKWLQHGS